MCTVSIISTDPLERAIRLVCNRDELRGRAAALPPVVRRFGRRHAVLPVDPASDGTWIALSDAGIIFTLLNVNARPAPSISATPTSRGRIIPMLLHADALDDAVAAALALQPGEFQPFRLVMLDRASCCEVASDGTALRTHRRAVDGAPILFTSSGLGDELVERPRRELFEQMVPPHLQTPAAQDAFHRHAWPGREHISVCMSRADARTVSRTAVELCSARAQLTYEPIAAEDAGAVRKRPCHGIALELRMPDL